KPGTVAPAARKLIDKARESAGWETVSLRDAKGDLQLKIQCDGTGRYVHERTLRSGLREQVICDGEHLRHVYREIGLASRRSVNKFHRAAVQNLIPWLVPTAEEIARDGDVSLVDPRTAAVSPRGVEKLRTKDGKPVKYLQVRLVFRKDLSLAERQLTLMPAGKTLLRVRYEPSGAMRLTNGDGKILVERKFPRKSSAAPELKPDHKDLVTVPMPIRSRNQVFQIAGRTQDGQYQDWDEEDALRLIMANLVNNPHEAAEVARQRFDARGDRRLGLFALLASTRQNWRFGKGHKYNSLSLDVLKSYPKSPLAKYLAAHGEAVHLGSNAEAKISGKLPPGLLKRLTDLRNVAARWNSGRARQGTPAQQKKECDRTLAFIKETQNSWMGWAAFSTMLNANGDQHFHETVAKAAGRLKLTSSFRYLARYEEARALLNCGQAEESEKRFRELFTRCLDRGFVPPMDGAFYQAFQQSPGGTERWSRLMREAAGKLIKNHQRVTTIYLAWQIRSFGDGMLAEELLTAAMTGASKLVDPIVRLAAVEYLHQAGEFGRVSAMLDELLKHPVLSKSSSLWRFAAGVSRNRGRLAKSLQRLETALDLEYERLPETVDLRKIRGTYGDLLGQYEQLANAMATLEAEPPADFLGKIIRAADRWRSIDSDDTAACQAAARIFQSLGARELAWEYLTTPVAMRPNEAAPWVSMAGQLTQQGEAALADRAYALAFEAETTNAQLLWDRAQNLQQHGRLAEARLLFKQIAEGEWQPRFQWLRSQAKNYLHPAAP
ncbi:MAG: hypothetical protein N2C14_28595, partial [Planctomycetales bacterium]